MIFVVFCRYPAVSSERCCLSGLVLVGHAHAGVQTRARADDADEERGHDADVRAEPPAGGTADRAADESKQFLHARLRPLTTSKAIPASTAMPPRIGGTGTLSRCVTVALRGPSCTVSRRRVYEKPPYARPSAPRMIRMMP